MYSPHKQFRGYFGGEGLEYFRILLIMVLSVGTLLWENGLVAQTLDPMSQSTSVTDREESASQSVERTIPIGENIISSEVPGQGGASFFMILRMILVLALAAAAIYGIVFFLKRLSRPLEQRNPYLKVLAGVHLGSNRFVHVVSLGSKAWLVGASEGGVSLISEIGDAETIDAMLLDESRKSVEAGTGTLLRFSHLLSRLRGGEPLDTQAELKAENVRKRRERLRGL